MPLSQMISEYKEWMRDNWNHPTVAIWDATNESWLPEFTNTIVPAVRSLDLSNRPWENSYNAPVGPDDPVEDHQYLLVNTAMQPSVSKDGTRPIPLSQLESMMGPAPNSPTIKTGHAMILNEYGWVWLNRDGTPTLLTDRLYPNLLGDRNNTENRFALQAYLLGGETEYWRAYRRYAGVLHFVYLTASDSKAFTSDHFQNLQKLTLEPHFAKAMEQAFNPLGVYLNFWQPSLRLSDLHDYTVAMVNDEDRPRTGKLRLVFVGGDGKEAQASEVLFTLAPLGAQSYVLSLRAPFTAGKYSLQAIASPEDDALHTIISSRKVTIQQVTSQR